MKLFKKGERRYTEATPAQIFHAAADLLLEQEMMIQGYLMKGIAIHTEAQEASTIGQALRSIERSKIEMLPSETIKEPRKGVEPA